MHWLAVSPSPAITPGTTTPIRDALHWAMLDGLITLGALVASIVQIIAVLRTLRSVTVGRKQQAELRAMMTTAFARQEAIADALGLADETARPGRPGDDRDANGGEVV